MSSARDRPAHIAHVLPWRNIGGTEIATRRLIQAAATHGHSATVLLRPEAAPVRDLFREDGVPIVEYAPPTPSYRSAAAFIADSRRLARLLRDLDVDAIHCADVAAAFHTAMAGRLAAIPVISHVRNRYRAFPWRLRPMLALVRHFIFVSRQTWGEFGYPVVPRRGSVLYDGIDVLERTHADDAVRLRGELGVPPGARLVGMVARVNRQKDLGTLAHAAASVLRIIPDARFVIVGDHEADEHRDYHAEIEALLASLGIREQFTFTGQRRDVRALLGTFDVFVLSTHWEGFPLVILEAMAAGLPVVATSVDGIPEVVRPHETGMLVPPADPQALADALLLVLRDPALARRLGEAGQARVRDNFSTERFTAAVGTLYERVLEPTRRRQSVP